MVRIDPGKFNVYFTLQTLTATDDDAGGTGDPVWETVTTFFGQLTQIGGSRGMRDTEFVFGYNYRITTHYMQELTQLNERVRLVTDKGMVLYITGIENIDEMNYFQIISCTKEK
jgi:head-tail adaptor